MASPKVEVLCATGRCGAACCTATALDTERRADLRRGLALAGLTVGWNSIEGVIAIGAGLVAGSIALVGFGADSFVEVLSGLVLSWRLAAEITGRLPNETAERRAIKLIAATFFVLGGFVAVESLRDLLTHDAAAPSRVGLALTALSLVVMPLLARWKRRLGRRMGSRAMVADSRETDLCAYLSATVFIGLAANWLLGWWWMDSLAALVIAALAMREGYTTWTTEDLCVC